MKQLSVTCLLNLILVCLATPSVGNQGNWPQGAGPNATFQVEATAPVSWSVVHDQNIDWKITLPETGQSTVVSWANFLFFSTMKPVERDTELGNTIVAYCCDSQSGKVLWTREIKGRYSFHLSSPYADSSAPPAVTDGERVCFFNASGKIVCFDFKGNKLWQREALAGRRCNPFLLNGSVVYVRQNYGPNASGHFANDKDEYSEHEFWGQVQSLNMKTGEISWASTCGVFQGCIPLLSHLDGKPVILVARGGGHNPPEKPQGLSLIDGNNGKEIWSYSVEGFRSSQNMKLYKNKAIAFFNGKHLWIDAKTGQLTKEVGIDMGDLYLWTNGKYVKQENEKISTAGSMGGIIAESNLSIGEFHYFRTYNHLYLGRVHLITGKVEYIELPAQMKRTPDHKKGEFLWGGRLSGATKASRLAFSPNDMKNSRGFVVMGDKRSKGNGWGHHASAPPTVVGEYLYIPTMSGLVHVIKWNAAKLDGDAIVGINDLGPVGSSWNRASICAANGKIYAHTMRELICIGVVE
jgi:outer membrane protein assembly factor BamB